MEFKQFFIILPISKQGKAGRREREGGVDKYNYFVYNINQKIVRRKAN
jgi:hypothetical protein